MCEKTNTQWPSDELAAWWEAGLRLKPRRTPREGTAVEVEGQKCMTIPLTKGLMAIVEYDLYSFLNRLRWSACKPGKYSNTWYAESRIAGRDVLLHRLLMNFPGCDVDHLNMNGLDCRRQNLRLATRSQNIWHRTPLRSWGTSRNRNGRFSVTIMRNWIRRSLGTFDTKEEAKAAYLKAVREHSGEFVPEWAKNGS